MSMTMTAQVCEHLQSIPRHSRIGDIYMKDINGELQLLKKGQRIIQKNYGHWYWRAGTVDCHVVKVGPNKYEAVI